jgi:hypothetical protein
MKCQRRNIVVSGEIYRRNEESDLKYRNDFCLSAAAAQCQLIVAENVNAIRSKVMAENTVLAGWRKRKCNGVCHSKYCRSYANI